MNRRRNMAHRDRLTYRELAEWVVFVVLVLATVAAFALAGTPT